MKILYNRRRSYVTLLQDLVGAAVHYLSGVDAF
jgi:hypothetical protein